MAHGKSLVVVESPAKAKTIASYLGSEFIVESSVGHIRDLPKSADEVPEEFRGTEAGKLGVDVENNFRPIYVIEPEKKAVIAKLKKLLSQAEALYLATDGDREGESIAWHLTEVLRPKVPVRRMVFHEITPKAIQEALRNPRDIDRRLVNAQEARRILDRLYGWEVSPVLWKKIMPRLSAGRVQSVATRLLVECERERMAFTPARYAGVRVSLVKENEPGSEFEAELIAIDGRRVATGKDFDERGQLKDESQNQRVIVLGEEEANRIASALRRATLEVVSIERKPYRRSPSPPFMTSTLQQEAGRKLRFSAQRTMKAAQRLYEAGYITYMRTDSTTLAESAIETARKLISSMYGGEYLPPSPRKYVNKVKNAQEAHEAIRPAGEEWKHPEAVGGEVDSDQAKVYELIWKRTLASQMQDARGESVSVRLRCALPDGRVAEFSASGLTIEFPGFLRVYVEGSDDPEAELESREKHLPKLEESQLLRCVNVQAKSHTTQPPPRYTEASLTKKLEELGVGRPSTYATILSTIQERGYVAKRGQALVPTFLAFAVTALLERHFPALVDYAFTAHMEDGLDSIARGETEPVPWLERFYFGQSHGGASQEGHPSSHHALELGLHRLVSEQLGDIDAREINTIPIGKDPEGQDIVVRVGRFGVYLQRGEDTAPIPEDLAPDELKPEKALELLEQAKNSGGRWLGNDPETGLPVYVRPGRYGSYLMLGDPRTDGEKPKTVSIAPPWDPATITLEEALRLLSLPRVVGKSPDGKEIVAHLGKFGPYLSKGEETRSLDTPEQLFSITLEEALARFAQPKGRTLRSPASVVIRELGSDPSSGRTIVLKSGRYGPYITDGEINVSIPKTSSVDEITLEDALSLIEERRAAVEAEGAPRQKTSKKGKSKSKTASASSTTKETSAQKAEGSSPRRRKSRLSQAESSSVVADGQKPGSRRKNATQEGVPS
ncbi:MAG: type I DNA topoisomerase [Sandaracinaceae bacterium]|nr:type I DNA topoisomerase [Sandaracinaceae bacterium]